MTTETNHDDPRFRVLIVDDDAGFAGDMSRFLSGLYDVGVAYSAEEALAQTAALTPDVVLLDITMHRIDDGFEALGKLRRLETPPEVIMLTGMRETAAVVRAIKAGAFHYVTKPPVISELVNLINLAAARTSSARRVAALESQVQRLGGGFVVNDKSMRRVVADLERVGPTDATVMIIGESGTGKEVVARHVHAVSKRADGPFVAVNCGAISEQLIESELFGHVRGAFTGAERDRMGCFEQARGGTIFLDEIGHAPRSLQVKLLRVLENREFLRVGSPEVVRANVRVIAASSRELRPAVDAGEFREELYHRLNVFHVALPPLNRRPDDILPLAEHFLQVYSAQIGRRGLTFSPAAREHMLAQAWRGNVRALRNTIERAVILATDDAIGIEHLGTDRERWPSELPAYEDAKAAVLEEFQRSYATRALQEANGNVTEAARRTGLARATLSRMISDLGLREGF